MISAVSVRFPFPPETGIFRSNVSLVRDVGEEVGDGLPVVSPSHGLGEHHGHVDALKHVERKAQV